MQVGKDVHNRCIKCGVVAHVVVAIVDRNVVQVECKECGSRHRPRGAAAAKKTRKTPGRTPRSPRLGPAVEPDLTRPIRPYQTSDTYAVGDRIDHQSFGTGVIECVMGPSKVQVYFPQGQKMLLHGRTR